MIGRWKSWRRRLREDSYAKSSFGLREFVYLDEVCVTSLLSSRLGKLPSEFTDGLTRAKKAELSPQVEANAATIFKARVGGKWESSWTEDSKVVSKATIQATFKRLYESEMDSFVMRPPRAGEVPPSLKRMREVLDADSDGAVPWMQSPDNMKRGRLAEFEVELEADPIFRVSAFVTALTSLANESKQIRASIKSKDFDDATELNQILDMMMSGLVPLKCRVVDYVALGEGDNFFIAHRRAAEAFSESRPDSTPIYLVGVAEEGLFWKDVRRVLFSGSKFRVLCRLNNDGLTRSWSPVKLVDVFGDVAPQVRGQMNNLGPTVLNAMLTGSARREAIAERRISALKDFSSTLARECEVALTETDKISLELIAAENAEHLTGVAESKKAFSPLVAYIESRSLGELNPVVVSQLRMKTLREWGFVSGGFQGKATLDVTSDEDSDALFIDGEIVAIYW